MDVLISLPAYLKTHFTEGDDKEKVCNIPGRVYLDALRFLAIDEADTMLDLPLDVELKEILDAIKNQKEVNQKTQIAVVSATITKSVLEFANTQFKVPKNFL